MKNIVLILSVLFVALLSFVSCEKDEDTESAGAPKATVKGIVYADLDLTNSNYEFAPKGTKVFFRIDASQLGCASVDGYDYPTNQYVATVGDGGQYSVSLPSSCKNEVVVSIQADQFMAEQTISADTYSSKVFVASETGVSTRAGQTFYLNIIYQ